MNLNKVFVLGRLTQSPEKRALPSGQPVVSFGVATNRYYTRDGEKKEEAEFHNMVAFGKLAETISQYLNKGSLALFEGRLRTRNWQDSSGNRHYRTEIVAERMQLGPRTTNQPIFNQPRPEPGPEQKPVENIPNEDIPVIEENSEPNPEPKENPIPDDKEEEIDVAQIPF